MCEKITHCETLSHYDNKKAVYKNKKKYPTHDKAVEAAKLMNMKPTQIKKVITYKCPVCHTYHIGRGNKDITPKYRKKLITELSIRLKIINKIEL